MRTSPTSGNPAGYSAGLVHFRLRHRHHLIRATSGALLHSGFLVSIPFGYTSPVCGIAGLYNWGDRQTIARMTSVQTHRGPDDCGLWERRLPDGTYLALGSRRLAILDLSPAGHMPMSNPQQNIWITYNGEIYNFRELRDELAAKGHEFHSHTDTEVLLRLYETEGFDCVKRLNGMFAFVIVDLRRDPPILFLARDHFGIKPLYYAHRDGRMAAASEVKALLAVPGITAEVDPRALAQYLTFLWVPDPRTMFRGVHKLPAGHYAVLRQGELKITQYWDLEFPRVEASYPSSEAELIEGVRHHLRRSVESQMISDVSLGAFLSAGMDSSSIVAMMRQSTREPVRTFTITYAEKYRVGEKTLDDPRVAARLAAHLGCQHTEMVVEPQVAELLPKLVWHMDEPIADPATLACYLVCREARKQVTVLLSGVGGDEVFGGYRKYCAYYAARLYRKLPAAARAAVEALALRLPPWRGTPLKGTIRLARKMARSASLPPQDAFLMNCTYLSRQQIAELCRPGMAETGDGFDAAEQHRDCFRRVAHADFLDQMLYLDTKIFMVSLNLTYNDKMSMASSVEARVPFLDRELVEFAAQRISPGKKISGSIFLTTKSILRQAMRGILPDEVLRQPKAAFAAPVDYWLACDLREMVDDLLSERQVRQRGYFEPAQVRRLIEEQRSGRQDWSAQLWQLLTFELWLRAFVDHGAQTPEAASASVVPV